MGVVAVGEGGFAGDAIGSDQLDEGLFHGQHAVGAAGFDAGAELMIVPAANQVSGCSVGDEDLDGWVAAGSV